MSSDGSGLAEFPAGAFPGRSLLGWLDDHSLAFTSPCGDGCSTLGRLDLATGVETPISSAGAAYHWSPELDAVAVDMAGPPDGLALMGSGGEAYSQVGSPDGLARRFLGWDADGERLLYSEWQPDEQGQAPMGQELRLLKVESGESWPLLPNVAWAGWSPDAERVAFLMLGRPVRDLDGRIAATDLAAEGPAALYVGMAAPITPTVEVIALASCGQLSDPSGMSEWLKRKSPAWSNDGRWLACWDVDGRLWAMDRDTGAMELVSDASDAPGPMAWAPSDARLALLAMDRLLILEISPTKPRR